MTANGNVTSTRKRGAGSRVSTLPGVRPLAAVERKNVVHLQNEIRNAINVSVGRASKLGIEPSAKKLKEAMQTRRIDVSRITLRSTRQPPYSDLIADYRLYRDGELLFRLKLVPWDHPGAWARWHVKRHPDATWWRTPKPWPRRAAAKSSPAKSTR